MSGPVTELGDISHLRVFLLLQELKYLLKHKAKKLYILYTHAHTHTHINCVFQKCLDYFISFN